MSDWVIGVRIDKVSLVESHFRSVVEMGGVKNLASFVDVHRAVGTVEYSDVATQMHRLQTHPQVLDFSRAEAMPAVPW